MCRSCVPNGDRAVRTNAQLATTSTASRRGTGTVVVAEIRNRLAETLLRNYFRTGIWSRAPHSFLFCFVKRGFHVLLPMRCTAEVVCLENPPVVAAHNLSRENCQKCQKMGWLCGCFLTSRALATGGKGRFRYLH